MAVVLDGIDHDEHARRGWHRVLHESVIVDLRLREAAKVMLAMVVIADDEMAGHIQPGHLFGEKPVSGIFAAIGEIAGDDTAFGVAMMAANVIDTAAEALGRVQAVQQRAGANQVSIGDVDEFHLRTVSEWFAYW